MVQILCLAVSGVLVVRCMCERSGNDMIKIRTRPVSSLQVVKQKKMKENQTKLEVKGRGKKEESQMKTKEWEMRVSHRPENILCINNIPTYGEEMKQYAG